ncbi:MAG: glycoside hydrolase 43 family protein [Bacteroidales bacterium]|nr:glycoside hydrolase 43 family protein [Bacteroidales bacterium]
MREKIKASLFLAVLMPVFAFCQTELSDVWLSDNGDGTYKNPILFADYSDPDAIRVGDDFYMVSSSFNCVPALPILHSKDLVNWELIGHALKTLTPLDVFNKPQHGNGVWAPCIRYHNVKFYIYYPDPDYGIYLTTATNPRGPWSEPVLVKPGKGLIDPSPIWDDKGNVYLAYAFAGSRAGIKSVIMMDELNSEGTIAKNMDVMLFDGHKNQPTIEGPKFYKRNGYYYLFAPAGGVSTGWQLVMRSKNIYGPYEEKVVMAQGNTKINGPHQGAWVTTAGGEDWFIHFQDKEAYGRIVHLQPMKWINDWPVIGVDKDGDGIGEPVMTWQKPDVGEKNQLRTPSENDEFNGSSLGLQWQWHANPHISWGFPTGNLGFLRLNCIPRPLDTKGLWEVPNLLLQKFPAEEFTATTKITFSARSDNEEAGFLVIGEDYQFISLKKTNGELFLRVVKCEDARTGCEEKELFTQKINSSEIFFRVQVKAGAVCSFSYSMDGRKFYDAGKAFHAKPGRWIGAKFGYFALREGITNDSGSMDIDWLRVHKNE